MMRRLTAGVLFVGLIALTGCHWPGRPQPDEVVPRPEAVMSFDKLYAQNCAGCHGVDGQNGAATNLANPVYEALVDDATLRDVIANGEKGTLMPAFGQSAGGNLTDAQVNAIVSGMRARRGRREMCLRGRMLRRTRRRRMGMRRMGSGCMGWRVRGVMGRRKRRGRRDRFSMVRFWRW